MLQLIKPLQTRILARSSCSKPECLQTPATDSPCLFPWMNTPGVCHAWMLADSLCSCRYPCFQRREDRRECASLRRDLLQEINTSKWKLVLRMGLVEGAFRRVPDTGQQEGGMLPCSRCLLGERGTAACVKSFPLVQPCEKLCWVRLWSVQPLFLPHSVGCGSLGRCKSKASDPCWCPWAW